MVSNIASQTSESSLRDFFAFCGDISMLHLYTTDAGTKEAIIRFDSEAAANTACLLNNALVDGSNIKVDLFLAEPSPVEEPTTPPPTNDSFASVISGLAASSVAFAEVVANKVKSLDKEYAVSDTVIAGASTAWSESKKFVSELDEKYHIKDSMNTAVQKTKDGVATAAATLNQKFAGGGTSTGAANEGEAASGGSTPKSPSSRNSPAKPPSPTLTPTPTPTPTSSTPQASPPTQ